MRRLSQWFRRSRPTAGGPVGPLPELRPRPYSSAWFQRRAHRASTAVHMAYGRFLIGHECAAAPEEIAVVAERAAGEWLAFARALRAETADVHVPDDLSGLDGGAQ